MKAFNMASLIQSKRGLDEEVFNKFLHHLDVEFKQVELDCLENLYKEVEVVADLSNFYMGYIIPQIGKEFDLLRFGKDDLINIELKSVSDIEKISNQLKKNSYYLNFIDKKIHIFSYLASENKLYRLDNENNIKEVGFETIIELLEAQEVEENMDLDSMFIPSNYLVSPFNSTDKFIENNYFLTEQQEVIKKSIIKSFESDKAILTAISGEPGTGKTLLSYDIAKHLMLEKNVAIIHCAYLNKGQLKLINEQGWRIFSVREGVSKIVTGNYDVIIIDEVQRMYSNQLEELYQHIISNNIKCLFSYDGKQCFSNIEFARKNNEKIEGKYKAKKYELKKKIRTNKEIVRFVSNLFEPRQGRLEKRYENIEIMYFQSARDVSDFNNELGKKGWQIINYTSSSYNSVTYDRYQNNRSPNAHEIIGQEFDKVIAVIDDNFFFDQYGYLNSRRVSGAPAYNMDKMLYQIMTRSRVKLMVIILNNPSVLKKCIDIIEAQ